MTATTIADPIAGASATTTFASVTVPEKLIMSILRTIALAFVVMGLGGLALYVASYPAEIGYGGQQWPFWIGFGCVFLVGAFGLLAWLASSEYTSDLVGIIIVFVLAGASAGLAAWGFSLGSWDWSQFGWGALVMGIVATAIILVGVYSVYIVRKSIK